MTPLALVEHVASLSFPNTFNPYSDRCVIHDRRDAPKLRARMLRALIDQAQKVEIDTIWIGRDLGYRGGRRTGIALTDEVNLTNVVAYFGRELPITRATTGPAVAERTAAVVWRMMRQLPAPVFTWNVFPLHPHESVNVLSNRCHTRNERLIVRPIMLQLLELLRPSTIVAIGNDAEIGLADLGIQCQKVRHPSYGGISDFERGIAAIYGHHSAEQIAQMPSLL